MDAIASIINLIAIRYALEPPDREHRFGHGKAEAIAGLAQASFIAGSAVILLFNAADRLLNPRAIEEYELGVMLMTISLVLTLCLVAYQRYVIRKTSSMAIKADALHYVTDILTTGATILAVYLAGSGWVKLDILIGIFIGFYILYSAWKIVSEALKVLLDHELDDELKKAIAKVIMDHKEVRGFHDFRTRKSGLRNYIQFHVELDDTLTLMQAHDVSEEVEESIKDKFPDTEAIVHIDPKSLYENNKREGFEETWAQK
jgi:ferrous-iron efflux pump FieF